MKHQFVKTENHRRFLSAATMMKNRAAYERCILAEKGKPGTGKTANTDNWGSLNDAVYLEGVPGMTLTYIKDALKAETGITERSAFAMFSAFVTFFANDGEPRPIILDECQHGFPNKAECIEYLRRVAEKARTILVIICHSSESHLLEKYEHIKTRIGCVCEMQPPSLEDTTLFASELCEIGLEPELVAEVHKQSGARYRLILDALANLERIAAKLGKQSLALADVKGISLCQDWEKTLKHKGGK